MKRILRIISIISFSICILTTTAFAQTSGNFRESRPSQLFIEFIDNCFEDPKKIDVFDEDGKDVTQQFINLSKLYYIQKEYDKIQHIIQTNNYKISYISETYSTKKLDSNKNNSNYMANDWVTVWRTKTFYHYSGIVPSNNNKQEWFSTLTGTFTYDSLYNIKYASDPKLEIDLSNFGGALWNIEIKDRTVDYNRFKNHVVFKAQYQIVAKIMLTPLKHCQQ